MVFSTDAEMWNHLFNGGEIEEKDGEHNRSYCYDADRSILVDGNGNQKNYLSSCYHYQKKENKIPKTLHRRKWVKYTISGVLDNPNWFESKKEFDDFYREIMISDRSNEWEEKSFELK